MFYQGKYSKPSTYTGSLLMRIALILLCLLLVSFHFTGGMYARYKSTAESSDSARVAKFSLDISGAIKDDQIDASVTKDQGIYHVTVDNNSEVAVTYDIVVTLTAPMSGLAISVGQLPLETTDHQTFTLTDVRTLAPDADAVTDILAFAFTDWDGITQDMTGSRDTATLSFDVTVNVRQVN